MPEVIPETIGGTLVIRFLSDWHCGTGQGRHGGVDREVARDADGLPYVPAKTLYGLWRDACERAAFGLDNGTTGEWTQLVGTVFGAPAGSSREPDIAAGLLTLRPARLPDKWRAALGGSAAEPAMLRQSLTLQRYGVQINDETGVAENDHLRLVERARAGLKLRTDFSVAINNEDDAWPVHLLLQAGAALWHHTGAFRRRGGGRCEVRLKGLRPLDELVRDYREQVGDFTASSIAALRTQVASTRSEPLKTVGTPSKAVCLQLTARLPLLCSRGVQGNTVLGLDFVPGATILPIIAEALGERAPELIRGGHVIVTDATPVIDGRRSVATPRSLMSGDKGRGWLETSEVIDARTDDSADAKPIGGWAALGKEAWSVGATSLEVRAFANIDDTSQRPSDNGLYTFEVIPAGTVLACEVRATNAVTADEWKGVLGLDGEERAVGRYRRTDFGLVEIATRELQLDTPPVDAEGGFSLWLTSDAYLTDDLDVPNPTVSGLTDALKARGLNVEPKKSYVAVGRRESWTATRALPRDSRPCLAAGSVVTFAPTPGHDLDPKVLGKVLASGIGKDRVEGFGQVRLLPLNAPHNANKVDPDPAPQQTHPPRDAGDKWAKFRTLAWREHLADSIRSLAASEGVRSSLVGNQNGRAQLGSLREAARSFLGDSQSLQRWVNSARDREAGGNSGGWGKALETVERLAKSDAKELSAQLDAWCSDGEGQGAPRPSIDVPRDLAGVEPHWVVGVLIGEVVAQHTLRMGDGK